MIYTPNHTGLLTETFVYLTFIIFYFCQYFKYKYM
jgi:hypothetical protein